MSDVATLVEVLADRRVVALTGAGCSTESGIPDYRGEETARRARHPMRFSAFTDSDAARRRYWARSMLGWPRVARAEPNDAHMALAELERRGHLVGVITQNVDGLHERAGSKRVVELHGRLSEVTCQSCGAVESRMALQRRLESLNPGWLEQRVDHAPDGDAELDDTAGFVVAACVACGGSLRPRVVFFGESVPRYVVESANDLLEDANALLVIGSSLVVFSGFRFVRRAAEVGHPIAIVNIGRTRADDLASVRVQARAGEVLRALALALTSVG